MRCYVVKNGGERSDTNWVVIRNGYMMRSVILCRKPNVASGLAGRFVAEASERLYEVGA